jgi:hypothetical protein
MILKLKTIRPQLTSGWDPGVKVTLLFYLKQTNPIYHTVYMCHVCSSLNLKIEMMMLLNCKKELECFIFARYGFLLYWRQHAADELASHHAFLILFGVPYNNYYLTCLYILYILCNVWLIGCIEKKNQHI